jgi:hypothetical protein
MIKLSYILVNVHLIIIIAIFGIKNKILTIVETFFEN